MHLGAHDHAAPAGAVAFAHAGHAVNDAARREVGRWNDFDQVVDRCVRVMQQVQAGIHHLIEVVRWNVGGHAHGDTR